VWCPGLVVSPAPRGEPWNLAEVVAAYASFFACRVGMANPHLNVGWLTGSPGPGDNGSDGSGNGGTVVRRQTGRHGGRDFWMLAI